MVPEAPTRFQLDEQIYITLRPSPRATEPNNPYVGCAVFGGNA
jgi:hypothetical protein